jgi:restriction system protein
MSRKNETILNLLARSPWWVSVALSATGYILFKYWVPQIAFENWVLKSLSKASQQIAPLIALLLFVPAIFSVLNSLRKKKLLDRQKNANSIRNLSWKHFEELVGEAYRRKGYAVAETGGGGADGGVDLVLRKDGEKLLVQCKHWKMDKVGVKVVRELYGIVAAESATGGIVISSGAFTREAMDFSRDKPLDLLNGAQLMNLVAEVQRTPMPLTEKPAQNSCPVCGAKMVLRTAGKGPNAGKQFWGCSGFPKCRGTRPFNP